MIRLGRILFGVLLALYPFAVYWSVSRHAVHWAAALLAAAALLQAVTSKSRVSWFCAAAAGLLAIMSGATETSLPVKFYPVAVNAAWLAFFALSLTGESVVEKLAKLREPNLPPEGCRYCRKVTIAWCGFFIVNGGLALDSALHRSDAWWALYNGLIAYGLIGLMFAGEWLVRRLVRKSNHK